MSILPNKTTYIGQNTWELQGTEPLGIGRTGDVWYAKNITHQYGPVNVGVLKRPSARTPFAQQDQLKQIFSERDALRSILSNIRRNDSRMDIDFLFTVPDVLDEGEDFLVMKKADGIALSELSLSRNDKKSPIILLRIVIGTIKVIQIAHSKGILYGDFIKDDHVFWDEISRTVTLIDWGNSLRFDTKSGNSLDLSKNIGEDITQVSHAIKKFLKNYPDVIASIFGSIPSDDYSLNKLLDRVIREYFSRNLYYQEKEKLPFISDFSEYIECINFIRQDEKNYKGIVEKNREFFTDAARNQKWQTVRLILREYPSFSTYGNTAALSVLDFIENNDGKESNVEWLINNALIGLDNFSEDEWLELIRFNTSYSGIEHRNLFRSLVKSTGALINKDVDFLYDNLCNARTIFSQKSLSYPRQISLLLEELEKFIDNWCSSPTSWRGISYSDLVYAFEETRKFFWEKLSVDEQEKLESTRKKLLFAESLAQKLLGDWENWGKDRIGAMENSFNQIQALDPDRRQLNDARIIVIDKIDAWLDLPYHVSGLSEDLAITELKNAIDAGKEFSKILGSAEWLSNKIQNLQNILLDYEKTIENRSDRTHLVNTDDPSDLYRPIDPLDDTLPSRVTPQIIPHSVDNAYFLFLVIFSDFIKNGDLKSARQDLEKNKGEHYQDLYNIVDVFDEVINLIETGQSDLSTIKGKQSIITNNIKAFNPILELIDWLELFQNSWNILDVSEMNKKFGTWEITKRTELKIKEAQIIIQKLMNFSNPSDSQQLRIHPYSDDTNLQTLIEKFNKISNRWIAVLRDWSENSWKEFLDSGLDLDSNFNILIENSKYRLVRNGLKYQNSSIYQLIEAINRASSYYKYLLEHPGQDAKYGLGFLKELIYINERLNPNVALNPKPSKWLHSYEDVLKTPYRSYDDFYYSRANEIESHPLVHWIKAYKPSPGFSDTVAISFKNTTSYFADFIGKAIGIIFIVVAVIVILVFLGIAIFKGYKGFVEVASPTVTQSSTHSTSPSSISIEPKQSDIDVTPDLQKDPSIIQIPDQICNDLTERDNQKLLKILLSLPQDSRLQLQDKCNLEQSYNELIVALSLTVVTNYVDAGNYQNALDLITILPEDIVNDNLTILNSKAEWLKTLFDICSQTSLSNSLSREGLDALTWFVSSHPDYVNDQDVVQACAVSQDFNSLVNSEMPIKSSLLIPANFNTKSLYKTSAYNVSVDRVSPLAIAPFRIFPTMLFNIPIINSYKSLPWQYLDRAEMTLSRKDIPYGLSDNSGWGILLGKNGFVFVDNGSSIQVYDSTDGVVSNQVIKEFRGQSINDFLSIRIQMIGNYAFFMYSYRSSRSQEINYELLPVEPIYIEKNPDLYLILHNHSSDIAPQIRFVIEKMDVLFRIK